MITDLLERQASGEEACRTGMAKGVPALVSGLDSEGDKSTIGDIVDAPRLHRPTGSLDAEEDFRAGRRWPHRIDVAGQALGDGLDQWIDLGLSALQAK
jgi:hypothetical protein